MTIVVIFRLLGGIAMKNLNLFMPFKSGKPKISDTDRESSGCGKTCARLVLAMIAVFRLRNRLSLLATGSIFCWSGFIRTANEKFIVIKQSCSISSVIA